MGKLSRRLLLGAVSALGIYYYKNSSEAKKHKALILDNIKKGLDKLNAVNQNSNESLEENEAVETIVLQDNDNSAIAEQEKLNALLAAFEDKAEEDASVTDEEILEEPAVLEETREEEQEKEEAVIEASEVIEVVAEENTEQEEAIITEEENREDNIAVSLADVSEAVATKDLSEDKSDTQEDNQLAETVSDDHIKEAIEDKSTYDKIKEDIVADVKANYSYDKMKEDILKRSNLHKEEEVSLSDLAEKVKEELAYQEQTQEEQIETLLEAEEENKKQENKNPKSALDSIVSLFSSKK